MDILDKFFDSEENQRNYGFEHHKDESGFSSIIFDGDFDELMNTAYEALGFIEVKEESEIHDQRPILEVRVNRDGKLVMKDTGIFIEVDVDGVGSEPNFFIRFAEGKEDICIRFNMLKPELYPNNDSSDYRFPNPSLSAINDFFSSNYPMLLKKWNGLRKDCVFELEWLPNYRAINRVS